MAAPGHAPITVAVEGTMQALDVQRLKELLTAMSCASEKVSDLIFPGPAAPG